jgi:hypothetical protein
VLSDTTRASEFCGSNSMMDWQLNIPVLVPGSKVSYRSPTRPGAPTATRSGKNIQVVAARAILQGQPSRSKTYLKPGQGRRSLNHGVAQRVNGRDCCLFGPVKRTLLFQCLRHFLNLHLPVLIIDRIKRHAAGFNQTRHATRRHPQLSSGISRVVQPYNYHKAIVRIFSSPIQRGYCRSKGNRLTISPK